jgi:hypothetical protein
MPMPERLQAVPKWPIWIGLLGAFLFLGGIGWIAVWGHSNRGGPDWLRFEAHPPFPSQEMVLFGFALLLTSVLGWVSDLCGRSFRGRVGQHPTEQASSNRLITETDASNDL